MKVFHNIFVLLFYGASLISGGAFFYRLHKERRSMWIGTLLSLFLLSLFFSSVFTVFTYSQEIQKSNFWMSVITILVYALALFLIFFPFAFLLLYFIQGIQILRKEGIKFHNFLSLAFSIGLFFFIFFFPRITFFRGIPLLEALLISSRTRKIHIATGI